MNDKGRKKIIVTFMLPMLLLYVVFQLYPIILNIFSVSYTHLTLPTNSRV